MFLYLVFSLYFFQPPPGAPLLPSKPNSPSAEGGPILPSFPSLAFSLTQQPRHAFSPSPPSYPAHAPSSSSTPSPSALGYFPPRQAPRSNSSFSLLSAAPVPLPFASYAPSSSSSSSSSAAPS